MKNVVLNVKIIVLLLIATCIMRPVTGYAAPSIIVSGSRISAGTSNMDDILFDASYYFDHNPDVAKSVYGKNAASLLLHYRKFGKKEGRSPSIYFDPIYYLNKYADLKRAFGNNYTSAYNHFVNNGIREGRQGSSAFSITVYKNNYEDLRRAFGTGASSNWKYLRHHRLYGKDEGRNAVTAIANSTLRISGQTIPTSIKKGSGFSIKGIVASNYTIKAITIWIKNSSGTIITKKTVYPNAMNYDIHRIDNDIKFGLAPVGKCTYEIWASDARKSDVLLVRANFTVIQAENKTNNNVENKISGKIKWRGTSYLVPKSFSSTYIYKQTTNKNCTKTAGDICISIYKGIVYKKTGYKNGCTWKETGTGKAIYKLGLDKATAQTKLNKAGSLIYNGIPSVLRLGTDNGHSVTVIGIRENANINLITYGDLLIGDPADGNVKTLLELKQSGKSWWHGGVVDYKKTSTTQWGLYIPIDTPNSLCSEFWVR